MYSLYIRTTFGGVHVSKHDHSHAHTCTPTHTRTRTHAHVRTHTSTCTHTSFRVINGKEFTKESQL
jgi:hypothetical protein